MRRRKTSTTSLLSLLVVVLIYLAYNYLVKPQPTPQPTQPANGTSVVTSSNSGGSVPQWGHQTKTSGCVTSPDNRPDPECTPGDILPEATKDKICVPGYTQTVRNVPDSLKNQVYAEYGITSHKPGQYEVDHFVSLELGGSNDISNLFPQPAVPVPGFHEKDKVENYLHDQVCSGAMSLQEAQIKIATNWVDVYNNMPK